MDNTSQTHHSKMIINRRGILGGLASMLAAPAIVHYGNLMPVKVMNPAYIQFLVTGLDAYNNPLEEIINVPYITTQAPPVGVISYLSDQTNAACVKSWRRIDSVGMLPS